MELTKTLVCSFALLSLCFGNAVADEDDMSGLVQKDFSKSYTGLDNTSIINYRPKDCDFSVNQLSKKHTSIFDKTSTGTSDQTTTPQ